MCHRNAQLTINTRLCLARLIVDDGWTRTAAAKMFMVSPPTAAKWARRYRNEGPAGMADRSSRPAHSPTKTAPTIVRRIVRLRWHHRLGPVQIAGRLGLSPPPCTPSWSAAGSTGSTRSTGSPASRFAATNTTTPAR